VVRPPDDTPAFDEFQPSVESVSVLRDKWNQPKPEFPKWMIDLARKADNE
jgi:hypothetical protein